MTTEECNAFYDNILAMREQWASDSNATENPSKIMEIAEVAIAQLDAAITLAGGHPTEPFPRVRP